MVNINRSISLKNEKSSYDSLIYRFWDQELGTTGFFYVITIYKHVGSVSRLAGLACRTCLMPTTI